jgi:hypothetical protein
MARVNCTLVVSNGIAKDAFHRYLRSERHNHRRSRCQRRLCARNLYRPAACSSSTSLLRSKHFLCEVSLRLSRACLGKSSTSFHKKRKEKTEKLKGLFLTSFRNELGDCVREVGRRTVTCGKRIYLFAFSLCLSRACLGKTITFLVLQKGIAKDICAFRHTRRAVASLEPAGPRLCKERGIREARVVRIAVEAVACFNHAGDACGNQASFFSVS